MKIDTVKLTHKQEKFVLNYAKTGNATESYKQAGYKFTTDEVARVNATKLLQKHNIQARLQEVQEKLQTADMVDIAEVKRKLTKIIRQEAEGTVVTMKGNIITVNNSVRDCIKAIECWCKINGYFITKQELDVKGAVPVVLMDDVKE